MKRQNIIPEVGLDKYAKEGGGSGYAPGVLDKNSSRWKKVQIRPSKEKAEMSTYLNGMQP